MPPRVKIDSSHWIVEKEGDISTLSAAVNLSASFLSAAKTPLMAVLAVKTKGVHMTFDGTTTPTSSVGVPFLPGDIVILDEVDEISNCKLIEDETSASVHYVFYNTSAGGY